MDSRAHRILRTMLDVDSLPRSLIERYELAYEMLRRGGGRSGFDVSQMALIASDWRMSSNEQPEPGFVTDLETGDQIRVVYAGEERVGTYLERTDNRLKVRIDKDDRDFRYIAPKFVTGLV